MSRIGKATISIPDGVEIKVGDDNLVTVKGPKGELSRPIDSDLQLKIEEGNLEIERPSDQKKHRSMHGLYRSLLNNMVIGVSEGYKKELELVGVGYRASNTGNLLEIGVGYSHPIMFYIPDELQLETTTEKGKAPLITLSGIDKELVGEVAAKIRGFRPPEPYKGKGIKYKEEILRRKAGKVAG